MLVSSWTQSRASFPQPKHQFPFGGLLTAFPYRIHPAMLHNPLRRVSITLAKYGVSTTTYRADQEPRGG